MEEFIFLHAYVQVNVLVYVQEHIWVHVQIQVQVQYYQPRDIFITDIENCW